ncbi:alpha/beta hydrolase family protein [Gilvimarinus algae]|uniref:Alpha/beta hydrolase n=1 Tax=Gilvimarinus algae TaxID=3058037 RepID=A0ABT8TJ82_9GAMM|nr:alpha/beta hydrolase [Gilvimarinus sp. SDUM040014]MDO3382721.1 alpha/beta hydrolase [Gilvimarinus sp. SDUM040014]
MWRWWVIVVLTLGSVAGRAAEFPQHELSFTSRGVQLSGSLVLPASGEARAAVVFVHGSGPQERSIHWAERFAAAGIAALVYDKRGVGRSDGDYESQQSVSGMNISLLADDAAAALAALKAHPKTQGVPLGFTGISQAGWIVPLAAEKSGAADFMALWSAPVCKVSEEDIFSKHTADNDGAAVPSYREALAARKTPYVWPDFLGTDTDPVTSLAELEIPGLWVFGGNDGSVPVDVSIERLQSLASAGYAYDYVLFSGLGHNNMTETFATVTDWILRLVEKD